MLKPRPNYNGIVSSKFQMYEEAIEERKGRGREDARESEGSERGRESDEGEKGEEVEYEEGNHEEIKEVFEDSLNNIKRYAFFLKLLVAFLLLLLFYFFVVLSDYFFIV